MERLSLSRQVYHAARDYPGKMMTPQHLCAARRLRILLLIGSAFSAAAQSPTAKQMDLQQTWYELRIGEPVPIVAPSETLDFLQSAKNRSIEIGSSKAEGFVVGPDRAGRMVLAASPRVKPGQYTVTLSATDAGGEKRQTSLTLAVKALTTVPSGSTRNPVVLLNGWETGYNTNYLSHLEQSFGYVRQSRPVSGGGRRSRSVLVR